MRNTHAQALMSSASCFFMLPARAAISAALFIAVMTCSSPCAQAKVRLPKLFSDHMVLQRDVQAPIWGWADPEETVTLRIADQEHTAIADANGRWRIDLDPLPAGGPHELTIHGLENAITLSNVLIGDVWICSGEAGMAWSMRRTGTAEQAIASADSPRIRLLNVWPTISNTARDDIDATWQVCSPQTAIDFSAVAYFFGHYLHEQLDVPIGLIQAAWDNTRAEAWTPRAAIESDPELALILARERDYAEAYPQLVQQYEQDLIAWRHKFREFDPNGPPLPPRPRVPVHPEHNRNTAGGVYNGMIATLTQVAICGVIWQQGESNVDRPEEYRRLLPALIRSWRTAWKRGDFPFIIVQLSTHQATATESSSEPSADDAWARIREAQLQAGQAAPHAAVVVTIDLGDAADVHTLDRQSIGHRLGLAATRLAYGRDDVVISGPVYDSMTLNDDGTVTLHFANSDGGLRVRGGAGALKGFELAGEDRQFHPADAAIKGNAVVVVSEHVKKPIAVRYGWLKNPDCNLEDSHGLPAAPFRTDTWND